MTTMVGNWVAIRAMLSAVALALLVAPASAATIGYWRFESNLLDSSGNGNDAAATGTTYSTNVFATPVPATASANAQSLQLDNPLAFTGENAPHYWKVAHDPSLNIATGSFTIEAWVRLNESGSDPMRQYIVHKKDHTASDAASSFFFMAKAGNLLPGTSDQSVMALGLPDGTTTHMIYSTLGLSGVADNDWHHMSVAVDRSSGNVRFTLDDQVDLQTSVAAVTSHPGWNNSDPLFIGAHPATFTASRPNGANWGLYGGVDELRISDTYLSTSQLLAVPEPTSLALAAVGALLFVGWIAFSARRRQMSKID